MSLDQSHIDYCAKSIRERSEKTDEYGRAILMDVAAGHIKFFALEGLHMDYEARYKFLQDCGLMK